MNPQEWNDLNWIRDQQLGLNLISPQIKHGRNARDQFMVLSLIVFIISILIAFISISLH